MSTYCVNAASDNAPACAEFVSSESETVTLLTLSWEDVVFSHILPHLDWQDLFRLRYASWQYKQLVDAYFQQVKNIDLSAVAFQFSNEAFKILSLECTNLRKLIVKNARWVTDNDLSLIFKKNRLLTCVDLTECTSICGGCLLTMAVNCKQLKTLFLGDCNWLSHGAVETLIQHLNSLEAIDLSSCSSISNQQLLPLVHKFYKMKELRIANLQAVNDTTLLVLAKSCTVLQILDIRGCSNTTDKGVKMVAEYCSNLRAIYVMSCHLVTEYSLRLLRCRGVQIDREVGGELVPYIPLRVQV